MSKVLKVLGIFAFTGVVVLSIIFAVVKVNEFDNEFEEGYKEYKEEVLQSTLAVVPTSTPAVEDTIESTTIFESTTKPTTTPKPTPTPLPLTKEEVELSTKSEIFTGMMRTEDFDFTGVYELDNSAIEDFIVINERIVSYLQTGVYDVKADFLTSMETFSLYTKCTNLYTTLRETELTQLQTADPEHVVGGSAWFDKDDTAHILVYTTCRKYYEEFGYYEYVGEITTEWEIYDDGTISFDGVDFMY